MKSKEQLAKDIRKYLREFFINDIHFKKLEIVRSYMLFIIQQTTSHHLFTIKTSRCFTYFIFHHPRRKKL